MAILGGKAEDILRISAKSGLNVEAVLEAVVRHVPPPAGDPAAPLRAVVFDSHYDVYKGVVAHVRVFDGAVNAIRDERLRLMATEVTFEPLEVGTFTPTSDASPVATRV